MRLGPFSKLSADFDFKVLRVHIDVTSSSKMFAVTVAVTVVTPASSMRG